MKRGDIKINCFINIISFITLKLERENRAFIDIIKSSDLKKIARKAAMIK